MRKPPISRQRAPLRRIPSLWLQQPWPTLDVGPQDKAFVPAAAPPTPSRPRLQIRWRQRRIGLLLSIPKGALLGVTAYAVAFGLAPQLPYWLMGWHWLLPLGGFVGLTLLAGLDIAVIGLLLALLWPAHLSMLSAPLVLVVFALGGIVVRGMFELVPW